MGWILDHIRRRTREGTPSAETCPDEWPAFMQVMAWAAVWERMLDVAVAARQSGSAKLIGTASSPMLSVFAGTNRATVILDIADHAVTVEDKTFPIPLDLAELDGWSERVGQAVLDATHGLR